MPPPSKKKLLNKKKGEQLQQRLINSRRVRVNEPLSAREVNLESNDEEGTEEVDLEGYPHGEIIEKEALSCVKRRKKVIEEFDKELLDKENAKSENDNDNYILMQASQLEALIGESVDCKLCGGNDFKIERVEGIHDLSTPQYVLKCCNNNCEMEKSNQACNMRKIRGKKVSDIIARFGLVNADAGVGYSDLTNIFTAFNLPVPSQSQISNVINLLLQGVEEEGKVILERCKSVVHKHYEKYLPDCISESGRAMIAVGYDGAWKAQDYNSPIGFGFVVDMETNLIVDFHVLCNFCQMCALKEEELNEKDFDKWVKQHKGKNECDQNFSSNFSSENMEPEIAKILWERSRSSNLWYTTMVVNRNSKSYTKIKEISPYGDINVEKGECHSDVKTRMKRTLKRIFKEEGIENRKEEGALTQSKVNALSNFFSKAIVENVGNIIEMKKAINASFYHHVQTPKKPIGIHKFCPAGKNSWCFYNKAKHDGKKPDPSKFNHSISITLQVLKAILSSEAFKDLTTISLLQRCTGKTQNINKSLHSRVWRLIPKEKQESVKFVKIAMWLVMVKHNLGVDEQGGLFKDFETAERRKLWEKLEKHRETCNMPMEPKAKKARQDSQKGSRDFMSGGGD